MHVLVSFTGWNHSTRSHWPAIHIGVPTSLYIKDFAGPSICSPIRHIFYEPIKAALNDALQKSHTQPSPSFPITQERVASNKRHSILENP